MDIRSFRNRVRTVGVTTSVGFDEFGGRDNQIRRKRGKVVIFWKNEQNKRTKSLMKMFKDLFGIRTGGQEAEAVCTFTIAFLIASKRAAGITRIVTRKSRTFHAEVFDFLVLYNKVSGEINST